MWKQFAAKEDKILIPGAGKDHELRELVKRGYQNVHVCDWAEAAVSQIREDEIIPKEQIHVGDFFLLQEKFDHILEMTFFCAIAPELRIQYVEKCHELLKPDGNVMGPIVCNSF